MPPVTRPKVGSSKSSNSSHVASNSSNSSIVASAAPLLLLALPVTASKQPDFVDGGRSGHNTKLKRTLYNRHFCLELDGAHPPRERVRTQGGDAPDGEADGE